MIDIDRGNQAAKVAGQQRPGWRIYPALEEERVCKHVIPSELIGGRAERGEGGRDPGETTQPIMQGPQPDPKTCWFWFPGL